jgi:hypothetical protein
MKRMLMILVPACMIISSCGLLNMVLNGGNGIVSTPMSSGLASFAPNPRNLQAQEDRGTGLYGYLNEYGQWAIAPTFAYALDFNDDLGIAVVQPYSGGRWGAIDVYGNTVILFNFTSRYDVESAMRSMINGRYKGIDLWEEQDSGSELWGFLDYYGNWYIQPQYKYACAMSDDGFALVQFMDDRWGVIDRTNRIIVQPNFNSRYDAESALRNLLRR